MEGWKVEGSRFKSDSGQKLGVIERYTERALRRVTVADLIISQTWFWTNQTNRKQREVLRKIETFLSSLPVLNILVYLKS